MFLYLYKQQNNRILQITYLTNVKNTSFGVLHHIITNLYLYWH